MIPFVSFDFQNTSQILDGCLSGTGVALIDPILSKEELAQKNYDKYLPEASLVNKITLLFTHSNLSIRTALYCLESRYLNR
jgi:hypothetical protein